MRYDRYVRGAGPAGESCKFLNGIGHGIHDMHAQSPLHNYAAAWVPLRGGAGAKLPSGGAKNSVLGVEYKN